MPVEKVLIRTICSSFRIIGLTCLLTILANAQTSSQVRVAVLDFGDTATGGRVANELRRDLPGSNAANGIVSIDQNLASAAAHGSGFQGSLNLTTQDARDIGAAIGCDFFIIGEADTVRRSPSTGAAYFESYASIFIVSARTGRLVSWERPLERRDTAEEAEKALLKTTGDGDRYRVLILRALEDES